MNGDRAQMWLDQAFKGEDANKKAVQEIVYALKTMEERFHRLEDKIRLMGAG